MGGSETDALEILDGLLDFLAGVHDKGAVADHGLADGPPDGDHQASAAGQRQIHAVALTEHGQGVGVDGLRAAAVYSWPKAVHEGNGTALLIVDEKADEAQRGALLWIIRGEETEPMTTMWSGYAHMTTTVLEPLFKLIDFEVDVNARTARLSGPGVIEGSGELIRNPVTGNIHRARLAHLLLVLRERFATAMPDGEQLFDLPVLRKDMAAMIGALPETVPRIIREMQTDGVAQLANRQVRVPEIENLFHEIELGYHV
ncbi:MAG: DUF1326 domain-containing protein [Rhodospirillales bacterium]|nr:DUF1326 domain-containing protein [Rhodospirillales bacterium]